jgi:hypothetical protein
MRTPLLFAVCAAAISIVALAQTNSRAGPFCWAGKDDHGTDVFVPCRPKERYGIVDLNLDMDTLAGLRIHNGSETIRVSREQLLAALADWRELNRAKP